MLLRQSLRQSQNQKIDPKIILANTILACSTMELTEVIEQELADNPALEAPDDDICSSCSIPKELCAHCPYKSEQKQTEESEEIDWREWTAPDIDLIGDMSGGDEEYDPLANLGCQHTLQDHLLDQLRSVADKETFKIGEMLIGSINSSGYFEGSL
ncbi:MAG: hypothetical protein WCL39_16215, partial [Armatimonadota bacterium]